MKVCLPHGNRYAREEGVNHFFCEFHGMKTTIASDVKFKITFPRRMFLHHNTAMEGSSLKIKNNSKVKDTR